VDVIIGLGSLGCGVASGFRNYPQYEVYQIDVGIKGYKKDGIYNMPKQDNHQAYESECPSLKSFFKGVASKEVLFVLSGIDPVSGAALQILQHLSPSCVVTVLYMQPDRDLLSGESALQDRLTCGVLQEYARSGVFKSIYLVSQASMENILGDLPLKEHQARIDALLVNTIHMVNVFKNTPSVMDTTSTVHDIIRIWTLGTLDLESGEEEVFFPLVTPKEKIFYYAIPEETIEKDGQLLSKIKKQMKQAAGDDCHASYMVHATNYEEPFVYCLRGTPEVQLF